MLTTSGVQEREARAHVLARVRPETWALVPVVLFGALYLLFLSRAYLYQGIRYAEVVERGDAASLAYPGHIGYGFVGALAYALAQALGYSGKAYAVLQALSVPFALAGLGVLYLLLFRWTRSVRAALVGSFGLGATYVYWEYGANAEVYALASFFLIATLYLVTRAGEANRAGLWIAAGLTTSAAVLIHQVNILLPVVVGLSILAHAWPLTRRIRALVLYGGAASVAILLPYLLIWYAAAGVRGMGFFPWALLYLRPEFTGGTRDWAFDLAHLWAAVYGLWRAFVGPFFVKQALLEGLVSPWGALAALALAASLGLVALLAGGLANVRSLWKNHRLPVLLTAGVALVYGGFITLWEASTLQYWFAVWIAFWCWIALTVGGRKGTASVEKAATPRPAAAQESGIPRLARNDIPSGRETGVHGVNAAAFGVVAVLFIVNLFGAMIPESDVRNNEDYQYSAFVMGQAPRGALILLPGWGGLSNGILLRYFGDYRLDAFSTGLERKGFLHDVQQGVCGPDGSGVYVVSDIKRVNRSRFNVVTSIEQQGESAQGKWDVQGPLVQGWLSANHLTLERVAQYNEPLNPNYIGNRVWRLTGSCG